MHPLSALSAWDNIQTVAFISGSSCPSVSRGKCLEISVLARQIWESYYNGDGVASVPSLCELRWENGGVEVQWGTRQKTQGKSSTEPSVQILVSPVSKSPEDFYRNVEQENGQEISGSNAMGKRLEVTGPC